MGVGRRAAVSVVRELAALGAGAAVCYASGFAETGPRGAARQRELAAAAAGMPLVGPNCYGTISAVTGAALWPDQHGLTRCERGAAFISQSGNIAVNLTMQRRGLPVAHVVTVGNQADVGLAEAFEALAADDAVTGVGLYAEEVADIARFAAACDQARRRLLPVAVLKAGATEASGEIAVTHTGSMVGSDEAYDALFRRLGARRVSTVGELLDTLAVVGAAGPLRGNRLVSLSCSGGEAALVADLARARDVVFPPFAPGHRDRVAAALDGRVAVNNPLDYHTFIWGDEARLERCFSAVLGGETGFGAEPVADEGPAAGRPFDAAMLVLDFPAEGLDRARWWPALAAFGTACAASGTPGVLVASMAENLPAEARARAAEIGLASCAGIDDALAALEAAAALGPARPTAVAPPAPLLLPSPPPSVVAARLAPPPLSAESPGSPPVAEPPPVAESPLVGLPEHEAKKMLGAAGIAVPAGRLAPAAQAEAAAARIGYPVVIKATGMAHKSEVAGVAVGLSDPAEVAAEADRLGALGDGAVIVEAFVRDAVAELLVSVRSAPPVGMLLTLGAGGTLVELLDDTAGLLLPADPGEVRDALRGLRLWPLLAGHRGGPPASVDAIVDAVDAVASLVRDNRSIVELEINPLLATPRSAVAVDALIVAAAEPAPSSHPRTAPVSPGASAPAAPSRPSSPAEDSPAAL